MSGRPHEFILKNAKISSLGYQDILKFGSEILSTDSRNLQEVHPVLLEINTGLFSIGSFKVAINQTDNAIALSCSCSAIRTNMCEHQTRVLNLILNRNYFKIFFDDELRLNEIRKVAADYGLEKETHLHAFFKVWYQNKSFEIKPVIKELLPVTPLSRRSLKEQLIPQKKSPSLSGNPVKKILILKDNKYYDGFSIELYEAPVTKNGNIKNPLKEVDPLSLILKTEKLEDAKFYTGISRFKNFMEETYSEEDIDALKILVQNPTNLDVFWHDPTISENISVNSIFPASLRNYPLELQLAVNLKEPFYEITGCLSINDQDYPLKTLKIKYGYFIQTGNVFYLIPNINLLQVINFFRKNNEKILIHPSKFDSFKEEILSELENQVHIDYTYIKPASKKQLKEQLFDEIKEKIIYLSEHENFVFITPVMKYGNIEVPVFSRKPIHDEDQNGNIFKVERDHKTEIQFTAALLRQHPQFEEQLNEGDHFYLHKDKFLDETWFLDAFEEWKNQKISILGFKDLINNKLNPNKAKISVQVNSGTDWFNTTLQVQFGKQKASLKQIHKSVKNQNKYVLLDDGTKGILPQEWMKKIGRYFQWGELVNDLIKIPKSNYHEITRLFDENEMDRLVKQEIDDFKAKLSHFESIQEIPVPETLQTTLRPYQQKGLNWLNFLDEFNFGACLADDMGLGKTVQVIAFFLTQQQKYPGATNLVVVPTSLLFNWQEEIEKFAPSLPYVVHYGAERIKNTHSFNQFQLVLTTYGMLASDIGFLKSFRFNYIALDESQAIKNPNSQRYKAACLLQSRNKIVLTGTPIENNTFDIYAQLSFACPGLLGSKQYFKDTYATPIDSFEDNRRALTLQRKISPFILRRTKKQVAKELPEKTEIIVYCEMSEAQRQVYDLYEKKFRDFIKGNDELILHQNSIHILAGLTKLRQICNSPALLKEKEFMGHASAKIAILTEQIEAKARNHKILVFSQFVGMLDLIKEALEAKNIHFEYLTGQTKNRESAVNTFQNKKNIRVFLISLKAGGTGLNLTEADYVYLVDPWWNPAVENQAIDRCYRIGQKKKVIAVRLITPNTIEEKIQKLQASKKELVSDLIKTDASMIKNFGKKQLLSMLGT